MCCTSVCKIRNAMVPSRLIVISCLHKLSIIGIITLAFTNIFVLLQFQVKDRSILGNFVMNREQNIQLVLINKHLKSLKQTEDTRRNNDGFRQIVPWISTLEKRRPAPEITGTGSKTEPVGLSDYMTDPAAVLETQSLKKGKLLNKIAIHDIRANTYTKKENNKTRNSLHSPKSNGTKLITRSNGQKASTTKVNKHLDSNISKQNIKDLGHKLSPNNSVLSNVSMNKFTYDKQNGVILDLWLDACMNITTWQSRWHPLFPYSPQDTTTTLQLGDEKLHMGSVLRRIYGYLVVGKSAFYDFQLLTHEGAEVLITDTYMTEGNFTDQNTEKNDWNDLLYFNVTLKEMKQQKIFQIGVLIHFKSNIKTVRLETGRIYFVEILQGGRFYAQYELHWKIQTEKEFKTVSSNYLFHTRQTHQKPSRLWQLNKPVDIFPYSQAEQSRINFYKLPWLNASIRIERSNYKCPSTDWYKRNITQLYQGRGFVDYQLVYPKNFFEFTGGWPLKDLLLNETEAKHVAHKVFDTLNQIYKGKLKLKQIVHVQLNLQGGFIRYPEWWQNHYFVEIDVTRAGKVFRFSHFVHVKPGGGGNASEICFMTDYTSKQDVMINILTPIKNQYNWLKYMLEMLSSVIKTTREKRVNLIIIDYNSTDGDVKALLKSFKIIKHQYIQVDDKQFSKVKALNHGLNQVTDQNSIMFIMDLHLQLPLNMFDRIRKFTIQKKTSFCPTLLKLQCGEHEQYTQLHETMWVDDGYGMMAMYRSDWKRVGGFNEARFGNQWGGEDWELVDRIVGHGIYIVHDRMPRFYHLYHNNKKTWDGNHL